MQAAFARGDFSTWGYDDGTQRRVRSATSSARRAQRPLYRTCRMRRPGREDAHRFAGASRTTLGRPTTIAAFARCLGRGRRESTRRPGKPVTAIACDTKPLAERAFAARAGFGWIGKHTNLIAPAARIVHLLGRDRDDARACPPTSRCARPAAACARCVDACPTHALRGDYTIDANRCISDLTQRTDAIPRAMRPLARRLGLGLRSLPTRLSADASRGAATPRVGAARSRCSRAPSLVELLALRSGEFKRRYRETAMGWRGAAVLRRNAAVALGNALDRSTVGALTRASRRDPHPMVRGHAAWALGRIGSPRAIAALRERYDG